MLTPETSARVAAAAQADLLSLGMPEFNSHVLESERKGARVFGDLPAELRGAVELVEAVQPPAGPSVASAARPDAVTLTVPSEPSRQFHLPGRHNQKTHGRRVGVGRDLVSFDWAKATDGLPSLDESGLGVDRDYVMEVIASEQGFDAKPKVVDADDLDLAISNGATQLFRGSGSVSADQLRDGDYRGGVGARGSGYYTTTDRGFAEEFVTGHEDVVITRMALDPDARVERYRDLDNEADDLAADDAVSEIITANAGRYGAAKGLDAMIINRSDGSSWYIVFNRGALIVEKTSTRAAGAAGGAGTLTAAAEEHTGAMVALIPSQEHVDRLAVDGGEPVDELHLTLMYLGEAADISDEARAWLIDRLTALAAGMPAVEGNGFAVSAFNPTSDDWETAIVLGVGGEDLDTVHDAVGDAVREVESEPAGFAVPDQHAPWVPHVTLAYSDDLGLVEQLAERCGPISFDRLRVAYGGDVTDIPLNTDGGAPVGDKETAVLAAEQDEEKQCPPGQHRTPDGECVPDEEMPGDEAPKGPPAGAQRDDYHFHALMMIEGVSTGKRTFAENSLDWREPPFAFRWQQQEPEAGGHALAWHVGNIALVERLNGVEIHAWGYLDLDDENGLEFGRKLAAGFAPWASIGLDEQPVDMEMVWPEDQAMPGDDEDDEDDDAEGDAEGDLLELLFAEPEQFIFHSGRICELTAVTVPALEEARVEALPALLAALSERGVMVASAVGSHDTGTSDDSWDGPANEKRLPSPMPVETARKMYAWIENGAAEDGKLPKSACKFPHHNVSADGAPGAANLAGCSAGIAVLNGGRGGASIPVGDKQGVYNHLAKHIRDGGEEPPEAKFAVTPPAPALTVVASGHVISIPDLPPPHWFAEPVDVPVDGALTITDEGRVYGMLALYGLGHRAFKNRRVEVPRGNVDYTRWMGGQALVAGGRVAAGPITMECGHYPPAASSSSVVRMDHYDNACSVVAKAAIGENDTGVWIAGALEPGVSADQVSRMMACRLSGDWAPHPERPGEYEFVAALLVPVPGFAQPRGMSTRVRDGVMVASAVPIALAPPTPAPALDLRPALERVARSIGRDAVTRMQRLRERVHKSNA